MKPTQRKGPTVGGREARPKVETSKSAGFDRPVGDRKVRGRGKFRWGPAICPPPIDGRISLSRLVDETFLAYNARRLREACWLFTRKMLGPEVTVGLSISGAMTPAGLGMSALIPLIKSGFIDWIVSTGANLYHDAHFAIGHTFHVGSHQADDVELRRKGVVRIYDIFFDYEVLLSTDRFFYQLLEQEEFQLSMSSADFHYRLGRYLWERERILGHGQRSLLSAAYEAALPVYTSSPGDSSIGMNVAALAIQGNGFQWDVSADVNETAAIVLDAKRTGGRSAVVVLGGGSPKNFALQTEPQLQEVLGIAEKGHDYFLQITDARPDTGGLSGATPAEAVSWGKIDPERLSDSVVCYMDATVGLPILTGYALANHKPRRLKRLQERIPTLVTQLRFEYERVAHRSRARDGRFPPRRSSRTVETSLPLRRRKG